MLNIDSIDLCCSSLVLFCSDLFSFVLLHFVLFCFASFYFWILLCDHIQHLNSALRMPIIITTEISSYYHLSPLLVWYFFLIFLSHMISFVLFYFIIYSLFHSFSSLTNLLHSTLLHFILLCELVLILSYLILSQIPLARIESYSQWEYERPVYAAACHHLQRSH